MTLDEVREALTTATWDQDVPLVTLFDDMVEHYDAYSNICPWNVTSTFGSLTQPTASSGEIVALVLKMRRDAKMKLYDVGLR